MFSIEEFEAWADSIGYWTKRKPDGEYALLRSQGGWEAWKEVTRRRPKWGPVLKVPPLYIEDDDG